MNAQIYSEASQWVVELRADEPDSLRRQRFAKWLESSPEHVRAYLELICLWEDAALLDPAREFDVEAPIAPSRADEDNVVPLHDGRAAEKNFLTVPRTRAHEARLVFASLMLFLGALAGWGCWSTYQRGIYATDIGEQRTLALPDGTTVELNAATRIRESYSRQQRTVELIEGQALFRVAKSVDRPFVVISGAASVRAVGTAFDVDKRVAGITVTVLEGQVAVLPVATIQMRQNARSATSHEVALEAGEQVVVTGHAVDPPKRITSASATAWTRQLLIFESATLAEAAEEFNRYNSRKLIVDPEGLGDFRVNGTFPALDPASLTRFLLFLKEQPCIALAESEEHIRVARNRWPGSCDLRS